MSGTSKVLFNRSDPDLWSALLVVALSFRVRGALSAPLTLKLRGELSTAPLPTVQKNTMSRTLSGVEHSNDHDFSDMGRFIIPPILALSRMERRNSVRSIDPPLQMHLADWARVQRKGDRHIWIIPY